MYFKGNYETTRRRLFGCADHGQNLAYFSKLQADVEERRKSEYNFDFREGCPTNPTDGGIRYEWTRITNEDLTTIPDFYRRFTRHFQRMCSGRLTRREDSKRIVETPGKKDARKDAAKTLPRMKQSRQLRTKVLKQMMLASDTNAVQPKVETPKKCDAEVIRDESKSKQGPCKFSKSRTSTTYCKKIISCSTPKKIRKTTLGKRKCTATKRRMSDYFASKKPSPCVDRKTKWQCTRHHRHRI